MVTVRRKRPALHKPTHLQADRFTMLRAYVGTGLRIVHEKGLTYGECSDIKRFPLGVQQDSRGRYVFTHVLTECLSPINYL